MPTKRTIDATFIGIRGKVVEQLGKWLHEPGMESSGKAAINRSKIQQAAADESRLKRKENS